MIPGDSANASGSGVPQHQDGPGALDAAPSNGPVADSSNVIVQGFLDGQPDCVRQVAAWAKSVAEHGVWGFETPEDIVQATLLAVMQNLRDGRFEEGNLRAYVRRIAKNMCITNYRRLKSRGEHVSLDLVKDPPAPGVAGDDIERRIAVSRILSRLDQKCREIVLFAYVEGYSRREIGRRLGISEESVRVRLFRCIQNARAMITDPQGQSQGC